MDERIEKLKRWLHRTHLSEYGFHDVLMKKRRDELMRIVKGDGSAIKEGQSPCSYFIRQEQHPWSQTLQPFGKHMLLLPLGKQIYEYNLVLYENKYSPKSLIPYGWICEYLIRSWTVDVDPQCWLKFTGWPNEYLERLLTILPEIAKEWHREDLYIREEFVKINKIRAIRRKVELLKAKRDEELKP